MRAASCDSRVRNCSRSCVESVIFVLVAALGMVIAVAATYGLGLTVVAYASVALFCVVAGRVASTLIAINRKKRGAERR